MRQLLVAAVLATTLCVVASGSASAGNITTGPVDQAGFQALVDAAGPGDKIFCLGGVYDFSAPGGVVLDKGLKIQAADPGDPPIFVGDGTVFTHPWTGNNGFALEVGAFIDGLTIKGLHLRDFDRAISFNHTRDLSQPGCPQIPGAGARNVKILDNTIRDGSLGINIFGGPFEDFVFQGNDVETQNGFGWGILAYGSVGVCPDGTLLDLVRPANGTIKDNRTFTSVFGIGVQSAEEVSIKANYVAGPSVWGIFLGDDKSDYFPDDGPISLGSVKDNVIDLDGGLFGIEGFGPTTIAAAEIKGNSVSNALIGVLLDLGANGFDVKGNTFSDIGVAEFWLGFDESGDPFALPPDSYDNSLKVLPGDRVFDFGVDNTIKIVD